jgi:hypothetical protein
MSTVRTWEPFPKQKKFLGLDFKIREALFGGAVDSGKTELLIMLPVAYGWHKHPAHAGILFRKTYQQLEKSIIPRAMRIYKKALGAHWNGTNKCWTFPSGAREYVGYLESEQDARDHDTNEYNLARFEELTQFQEFCYRFIVNSRLRSVIPELPPIARSASNPGGIGNNWVRDYFVKPFIKGDRIIQSAITKQFRYFLQATVYDNPLRVLHDPAYIEMLKGLPEAEKRAKLYGDWWAYAGEVFKEFRPQHFEDEPENAVHVIEPFDIPAWWPVVLAIDWGYRAHTWAGWFAISPEGRVYLYKEYMVNKTSIQTWAAEITALSQNEIRNGQLRSVELDPSAWQRRGTEKDIWQQFYDGTDRMLKPHQADNARIHGKQIIHDMLRWQPRPERYVVDISKYDPELAQRIIADYGLRAYNAYLAQFQEDKEEGPLPRLQIFNQCQHVIEAIQACNYNEDGKGSVEDVAEWNGDDPYDGLRYGLTAVDRYLNGVTQEAEERRVIDNVVQTLHLSQDYTKFYRQMEYLESKRKVEGAGLRNRLGWKPGRRYAA